MIVANQRYDFGELMSEFRRLSSLMPDKRSGKNVQYRLSDIVMSAYSLFFMQCESFLAHQRAMEAGRGSNNAQSLFGIEQIPTDNHIRDILDGIPAQEIEALFGTIHRLLKGTVNRAKGIHGQLGMLDLFVLNGHALSSELDGQIAIALDGVSTVSSYNIGCSCCNEREIVHKKGNQTLYYHSCIAPVVVVPGYEHVLSLAPVHIGGQVGVEKQDCELMAARRWLESQLPAVYALFEPTPSPTDTETGASVESQAEAPIKPIGINILGDDLYAHQPFCEQLLALGLHYVLVCKPTSHTTLYEEVDLMQRSSLLQTHTHADTTGAPHKRYTYHYRFANGLPLRAGKDALLVNWVEITVTDYKGKQVYHNAFITDHTLHSGLVAAICALGRARWKAENESHNTLKTKGYNLEHNFGHGKTNLTQTLTALNILAFLTHTCLALIDLNYQFLRNAIKSRKAFFNHIESLTTFFFFPSWNQLLVFMIQGLHQRHIPNAP